MVTSWQCQKEGLTGELCFLSPEGWTRPLLPSLSHLDAPTKLMVSMDLGCV